MVIINYRAKTNCEVMHGEGTKTTTTKWKRNKTGKKMNTILIAK